MNLTPFLKSVLEADRCPVVLCNLEHEIVYLNPAAAARYAYKGGSALLGSSLFDCHNEESNKMIKKVVDYFMESIDHNIIYTFRNEKENKDVYMVALRYDEKCLIGYYEKHEYRNQETMKLYDFK